MAISVLDVRDTFVPPRVGSAQPVLRAVAAPAAVPVPTPVAEPTTETAAERRRPPVAAVVLAVGGVVQGLGIVATALTVLANLFGSAQRPSGVLVGAGLVLLAGWVVLAAAGGACVLDGTGRRLLTGVAYGELGLLAVVLVAGTATSAFDRLTTPVPVPALALLAVAVPVGKLLLAGAPSTAQWLAQGPRVREERPDPARTHRLLCTVTLGVIGLALVAAALLVPSPADGAPTAPVSSSAH